MSASGGRKRGQLFVISGPSGSGKTTIVKRLRNLPGIFYSVSTTSRAARPGEVEGRDYRFVTREEFLAKVEESAFAEFAEVAGNFYGTPRAPLEEALERGVPSLVDIDVQGAMQIKKHFPGAKLIFVEPPSMEVLERRLRGRGTESEEDIARRLELARREIEWAAQYDYRVVNADLERAVKDIESIVKGEEG